VGLPALDRERLPAAPPPVRQDALAEGDQQRLVAGEDAELALQAGQLDLVRLGVDQDAAGRDDPEMDEGGPIFGHCAFNSSALFTTSSIVPIM
jgi:hypothetical protein